jgi:hypothetical protein
VAAREGGITAYFESYLPQDAQPQHRLIEFIREWRQHENAQKTPQTSVSPVKSA